MSRSSIAAVALLCAAVLAGRSPATPATGDLADRFAALPAIAAIAVAPDGKRVALACEREGRYAVCVHELDTAERPPLVIRTRPEQRLRDIDWAGPDWVLIDVDIVEDLTAVTLNRRLVRLSRLIAHNVRTGASAALLVNPETGFTVELDFVAAKPQATPDEILMLARFRAIGRDPFTRIGSEDDDLRTGLYRVDLKTGRGVLVEDGGPDTTQLITTPDGRPVARVEYDGKIRRYRIFRLTGDGAPAAVLDVSGPGPARYSAGGLLRDGRLALSGYAGADMLTPLAFDLSTGRIEPLANPPLAVDIDGWISEGSTSSIVGFRFTEDVGRQRFLDPKLQSAQGILVRALRGKTVTFHSWSDDRMTIGLGVAAPGEPEMIYLYDAARKALSPVGESRPGLAGLAMAPTRGLRYPARDGLEIDAYLSLPPGKDADDGPFPLLLFPHGGPFARDDAGFDWWSAYFTQHGYAVLKPNFRGSSGYGRAFREKGFNEFGGAMIDDIIDGAKFLVARHIADPDRICAMGASYGGYAALMIPVRDPSIVRCVLAVNGVTEPDAIFGETVKRYGSASGVMEFWEDYLGSRFRDPASKAAISPLRSAAAIKVPVLLLHATQDTAVPVDQSRALRKRIEEAGGTVRLVELEGGDHFLDTTAMRETLLREADAFFASRLAAR